MDTSVLITHHMLYLRLALISLALVAGGCSRFGGTHLEKGSKFMKSKDYARAILEFKSEIRQHPDAAEPYYQLGLAYLETGDNRGAVSSFRNATKIDPKHIGAQLKLADIFSQTKNKELLADAEKRAEQVLAVAPNTPDAISTIAVAELGLGETDSAVEKLEDALNRFPSHLRSAELLAMIRTSRRDLPGAEAALRKVVQSAPNSADAAVALARFHLMVRNMKEAETEFRGALQIDPKQPLALLDLAILTYRDGRRPEGESLFARLTALPGEKYKSTYGRFLFQEGRRADAIAELDRQARQNPDSREIRTLLVTCYAAENRLNDAEKVLAAALQRNARDIDALLQLSEIQLRRGKLADAEKGLNQVVHDRPDSAEAHLILSRLRQAQGADLSRRQELDLALRYKPDFLAARAEMVQLLLSSRQTSTALQVLDQAPARQKSDPIWIAQRNWVLMASGDYDGLSKGIAQGLAIRRSRDFLLQDALLRIQRRDFTGARNSAQEVLKRNPTDLVALEDIMVSYVAEKKAQSGLEFLKQVATQHAKSAPVQQFYGKWLLTAVKLSEARAAFMSAKAADPTFATADFSLAKLDFGAGDLPSARKTFTQLLESPVYKLPSLLWLGQIDEKEGNPAAALQKYRTVVETDKNNVTALNNLAYLLIEYANQPDEALQLAQRVKELAPDSRTIDDTLGWAYFKKGMYTNAIRHLENAVQKGAAPVSRYHLAMAYMQSGDSERGRKTLEIALKQAPDLPEAKLARRLSEATTSR